jgi:HPt (histidine-containing phosphotransfer) domain-containing protein
VQSTDDVALDLEQFRNFTLDDRQLMREILWALIDDTTRQAGLLEGSIRDRDGQRIVRLTRTAARACSNVGAIAAAAALNTIGHSAGLSQFDVCRSSLEVLRREIGRLRDEASAL